MPNITMTQEFYEALVHLAQAGTKGADGAVDANKAASLDLLLRSIEKSNGITRHSLWISWQDATSPLPPTARFPEVWPPELRYFLQLLSRPIAKEDVLQVVRQRTRNYVNVLVTKDPAGKVGWTKVDDFFLQP